MKLFEVTHFHENFSDSSVNFLTPEHAKIALNSLTVDEELQPLKIRRTLSVEDCILQMSCTLYSLFQSERNPRHLEATEARLLRVGLSSIYDMLLVVTRTLQEFS